MLTSSRRWCSEKSRETSRYEYPYDAPTGAGTIKLMHSGWAGKYVGQALLQYNPATLLLNQAFGSMVPTGVFFDDALMAFSSGPPPPSPLRNHLPAVLPGGAAKLHADGGVP